MSLSLMSHPPLHDLAYTVVIIVTRHDVPMLERSWRCLDQVLMLQNSASDIANSLSAIVTLHKTSAKGNVVGKIIRWPDLTPDDSFGRSGKRCDMDVEAFMSSDENGATFESIFKPWRKQAIGEIEVDGRCLVNGDGVLDSQLNAFKL